jgi:hypothetical protein
MFPGKRRKRMGACLEKNIVPRKRDKLRSERGATPLLLRLTTRCLPRIGICNSSQHHPKRACAHETEDTRTQEITPSARIELGTQLTITSRDLEQPKQRTLSGCIEAPIALWRYEISEGSLFVGRLS